MVVKRVAIVGAGEMGHGIALLFAIGGYDVSLMDKYPEMLEKAKQRIVSSLARSVARGRLEREKAEAAIARIYYTESLGEAVATADLVVEAVPESPELKKSVMKEVCERAPVRAVIASNTSNIMISELAEATQRPEKVVGMHFFNPAVTMKAVEVIPGNKTDPAVVDEVSRVSTSIGRTPVRVLKDSPGFIVDRINAADTLFFCLILDMGIATPPEVDTFAKGQGLPMGVYELLDFVGIDVVWDSLRYFSKTLSPEYGKGVTFGKMVEARRLGKKTGMGFYDWSSGRAMIPVASPTDRVSLMDIFALEINEAVKLIEEGVARPDEIEKGVTLGMNRPFGPISLARDLSNAEVKSKLEELASRFDCSLFSPARSICEGRLREVLEAKTRTAGPEARPEPPVTEADAPPIDEAVPSATVAPEAPAAQVPPDSSKAEAAPEAPQIQVAAEVPQARTATEVTVEVGEESPPVGAAPDAPSVQDAPVVQEAPQAPPPRAEPEAVAGQAKPASEAVKLVRLGGGVAKIVLNRPRLNTINGDVLDALDRAVTELWDDRDVRVVVVTGEGKVFSAGADLSQFFRDSVSFMEFTRKGGRIFKRLSELPKLTLAVLKGYALGGGLELALSCDLRLATEDADLGFPELTRGLVPTWTGTQVLPRIVGLSKASELILTSERITGKRAQEIGLVAKLIPPGDPDEFVVKYATELASTQAPVAVMLAKRLLREGAGAPSDAGLEMEALAAGVAFGTDDVKEGVSAFLGKRKPEFKGK